MSELDKNAVKLLAEDVVNKKMKEICDLKHDKIIGCIHKKFNQFYFRFAIGIFFLVLADYFIKHG